MHFQERENKINNKKNKKFIINFLLDVVVLLHFLSEALGLKVESVVLLHFLSEATVARWA